MAEESEFTPDDLEPTQFGAPAAPAPAAPTPARGARKRESTRVRPDEVIPPGGRTNRGGRPSNEEKERKAQLDAERRQKALVEKVTTTIDAVVNPMLANVARLALQVPPILPWMEPEYTPDGQLVTDARGVPNYHYMNGAQLVILQPLEMQMVVLAAPFVEGTAIDKAKETAKKFAPAIIGVAAVAFAASYAVRLRQVKNIIGPQIEAIERQRAAEAFARQEGGGGEGSD